MVLGCLAGQAGAGSGPSGLQHWDVVTDSINGLIVRRMYLAATKMVMQSNRIMTVPVVGLAYVIGIIKLLPTHLFGAAG